MLAPPTPDHDEPLYCSMLPPPKRPPSRPPKRPPLSYSIAQASVSLTQRTTSTTDCEGESPVALAKLKVCQAKLLVRLLSRSVCISSTAEVGLPLASAL